MDKVINFLKRNKDNYLEYFEKNRLSKLKYGYTCEIDQIFCYLDLIDIESTEYYKYFLIIKKYFDLNCKKILEVGCGYIPILSAILYKNKYDIDAVDKKIVVKNYMGVNTIEYNLKKEYNLDKYDLIVGLRPCDITENIIDYCIKYKKEFIIYLCPCVHEVINNQFKIITYDDWIKYLVAKINMHNLYELLVVVDENLPDSCPILIGKIKNN